MGNSVCNFVLFYSATNTPAQTPPSHIPTGKPPPSLMPTPKANPAETPPAGTPILNPTPGLVPAVGSLPSYGFVVGDKPFQFLAAASCARYPPSQERDVDLVKDARAQGFSVLSLDPPWFEDKLRHYDEAEFVRLDHLLDTAYRNGVYVIIPFIHGLGMSQDPKDPYYHPGGIEGLVKDPELKEAFRKRTVTVITRVNTVNGKKYSEDPTILAWLLCEEMLSAPQNYPAGAPRVTIDELRDWVEEISSYVRSLDTNRLLTIEPGAIAKIGDNWLQVLQIPSIDFIRLGDAEGRIIHLTQDDNMDILLKVFTIDKPVVMGFSFDGGSVNQELYSKDYAWQAENLRKIFKAYYEMGVSAGFIIYSWASDLDTAYLEKGYAYTASNKVIAQALVDIAYQLGSRNTTTVPIQFVKLSFK